MTPEQQAAMRQALEALEGAEHLLSSLDVTSLLVYGEVDNAITAMRRALEQQPADEPVAWWKRHRDGSVELNEARTFIAEDALATGRRPLVFGDTRPQPAAWIGLTDEERREIYENNESWWEQSLQTEAKLREKNAPEQKGNV